MHTDYPVGERWIFDIGVAEIEHHYVSATKLDYRILTGDRAGETGSTDIEVVPVSDAVFFVSWQEHDRSTVVHLEDFGKGTFVSCYTSPTAQFFRTRGKMRRA
ncbi:MAG: MoaF N-terminal domain-containing protein [Vicinamibacterales bacterium]